MEGAFELRVEELVGKGVTVGFGQYWNIYGAYVYSWYTVTAFWTCTALFSVNKILWQDVLEIFVVDVVFTFLIDISEVQSCLRTSFRAHRYLKELLDRLSKSSIQKGQTSRYISRRVQDEHQSRQIENQAKKPQHFDKKAPHHRRSRAPLDPTNSKYTQANQSTPYPPP